MPSLGRFASADTLVPDPTNPQQFNRFSYVFNQPLIYNDPSGHCPWCIGAVVGAVGGALTGYGVQVYENIQEGHSFVDALTTDISAEPILIGAGTGLVLGGTLGAAAPVVAPYMTTVLSTGGTAATYACNNDGDCTNEATMAAKGVSNVVQAISADGDSTNEIRAVQTGTHTIYQYVGNGTRYIGQTNNFARRLGEHLRGPNWNIEPIQGLQNLSKADARAVEQVLINRYGLENLLNRINIVLLN